MTATVTTVTFKRIKDYVLALKEKTDRKGVLVSPDELRAQLQATDAEWNFTDAEMMTAVGHLETHGYVAVLRSSASSTRRNGSVTALAFNFRLAAVVTATDPVSCSTSSA